MADPVADAGPSGKDATAGFVPNASLTVRIFVFAFFRADVGREAWEARGGAPPSFCRPHTLTPSTRANPKQEEEIERVVAPESAVEEEERLRREREAAAQVSSSFFDARAGRRGARRLPPSKTAAAP